MVTYISHSPAETEALGESWGRAAEDGLVIALRGDLGAGKTQLVKGLARGLEIHTRVHSPTFTLVNTYTGGRLTLRHLDLYRLESRTQIVAAGLEDCLAAHGVTVIEWGEKWFNAPVPFDQEGLPGQERTPEMTDASYPPRFRWVDMEPTGETERRICYEDFGA